MTALVNCVRNNNTEWEDRHTERLLALEAKLPHGSGLDEQPKILVGYAADPITLPLTGTDRTIAASRRHWDRAFFIKGAYHHMNEHGYYVGWTSFTLRISATFQGLNVEIAESEPHWKRTDEDDPDDPDALWEDAVDYICEVYHDALMSEVEPATAPAVQ